MNRIESLFARRRAEGTGAFVAYIGAGVPGRRETVDIALHLARLGVDAIELGIPFSDPYGDGAVNQQAAEEGLRNGVTIPVYIDLVRAIRAESDVPLIAFGYSNPIFRYGPERFCAEGAAAGLDGLLVVDVPVEETDPLDRACRANGMINTFLTAPTSTEERLGRIAGRASGFIYHISRTGVTGEQTALSPTLPREIAGIRALTPLPVVVGFGINTADQVRQVCGFADGAVVGSAIVKRTLSGKPMPALLDELTSYLEPLASAAHEQHGARR